MLWKLFCLAIHGLYRLRKEKRIVKIITSEEAQYFIILTWSNPEVWVK